MFGYVRPVRGELKCKDLDLYRATYCGLCRTIRRRCGIISSIVLNFDFTFLALLLAPPNGETVSQCRRCHVPPFRRKCMCEISPGLELAADESVILAYWQLQDKICDETGVKRIVAKLAAFALGRGYRRAAVARPDFDRLVSDQIQTLSRLESSRCASLDRPADTFAKLLSAAVPEFEDMARNRAMNDLLYHLGRWIYLIDARDDLAEDVQNGHYNPIHLRFCGAACDAELEFTLNQSVVRMRAACALLDLGRQKDLIENILYYGLPAVQRAVFEGRWAEVKKQKIWRNNR